jgi:hypothetical protein
VIGKFDKLYKMCVKLKNYKELYKYYKKENQYSSKKTIKIKEKKKCCFKKKEKIDAEEYYKEKIIKMSNEIQELKAKKS